MSHLPVAPDDPRLTAYVLGELEPADAAAIEEALVASPELRSTVVELRETTSQLFAALQSEPTPAPAASLPQVAAGPSRSRSGRNRFLLINAVTLLILVGVVISLRGPADGPVGMNRERRIALAEQLESREMIARAEGRRLDRLDAESGQARKSADELATRVESALLNVEPNIDAMHRITDAPVELGLETAEEAARPWTAIPAPESATVQQSQSPFNYSAIELLTAPADATPQLRTDRDYDGSGPADAPMRGFGGLGVHDHRSGSRPGQSPAGVTFNKPAPTQAPPLPVTQYHSGGGAEQGQGASSDSMLNRTSRVKWFSREAVPQARPDVEARIHAESRGVDSLYIDVAPDAYYAGHRFMLMDIQETELLARKRLAEPSGPGTEAYAPIVENDFIAPEGQAALSTFSLDVDTASYSNVRRFLTQQQLPPANAVRIEELVNYFAYDLPQPEENDPFSVTLEATSCPWNPQHRLVRIGLQGRELDLSKRPLTRLVFLLDVSGSMSDANKLPLVKESMKLLVEQLGENDRIAIVTYSDTAELRLDSTSGNNKETILAAIDALSAGGSTNGAGGIQLAYETASKQFLKDAANRVILCTDGDFNVGVSSDDALVKMIEEKRESGVFLSIFGYGMGNLKDSKLEGLADKGNGHYGYIDDLDEARKVFIEELTGTLYTIAKDVKLQVEFNPAKVGAYRLLGYENRTLAAEDFNNDQVDAGELGAGHTVTALYEIVPKGMWAGSPVESTPAVDPLKYQAGGVQSPESRVQSVEESTTALDSEDSTLNSELLTVKLRYKQPDGDESVKREFPLAGEPKSCSNDLQFAAAVAGFGLLLRDSQYAAGCNWDLVIELAEGAKGDDSTGRRGEFIDLARQAHRLWDAAHPHGRHYGRPQQYTSYAPTRGSSPAAVGLVTELDGKYATISIGANQGVRDGDEFQMIRVARSDNNPPQVVVVGSLRVIDVQPDHSIGRFTPHGDHQLEVGDHAMRQGQ